jgi:hypothetical protein
MGCSRTSSPLPVRNSPGPIWSKKMKGPKICRCVAGKARRTSKPPISWAGGRITLSTQAGIVSLDRSRRSSCLSFQPSGNGVDIPLRQIAPGRQRPARDSVPAALSSVTRRPAVATGTTGSATPASSKTDAPGRQRKGPPERHHSAATQRRRETPGFYTSQAAAKSAPSKNSTTTEATIPFSSPSEPIPNLISNVPVSSAGA